MKDLSSARAQPISVEVQDILTAFPRFRNLPDTRVTSGVHYGQRVYFTVADPADKIQRFHDNGNFYEPKELALIARFFPIGGVFCDVGANVGNHSIYALRYLAAARSIVFEPNPAAYRLLVSNMILNDLITRTDIRHLGCGIAAEPAEDYRLTHREGNLGAARLVAGEGDTPMRNGDTCIGDTHVDFIKIDVEGMEIEVLDGFAATIRRCQPPIFLELERVNERAFAAWMDTEGYAIAGEGRAFKRNRNILVTAR